MKKLITTQPGGFPLTLDRIRWMEAGINEALLAICRSLVPPGSTSLIIEGCEVIALSEGNYSIAPGWVYINDLQGDESIRKVDAQTFSYSGILPFPTGGTTPRWSKVVDTPNGTVTFYDGSTKVVETVNRATIVVNDEVTKPALASVPNQDGSWLPLTNAYNNANYNLRNGNLSIRATATESCLLGTLPPTINPGIEVLIPVACQHADGLSEYGVGYVKISNSGAVNLIRKDTIGYDVIYQINISIAI